MTFYYEKLAVVSKVVFHKGLKHKKRMNVFVNVSNYSQQLVMGKWIHGS